MELTIRRFPQIHALGLAEDYAGDGVRRLHSASCKLDLRPQGLCIVFGYGV